MIISIIYLYATLLIQAPETLIAPKPQDFATEQGYEAANERFRNYGRWNS